MVITSDQPMKVYVLWQEIVFSGGSHGGEIFFARSTDGGKSFTRLLAGASSFDKPRTITAPHGDQFGSVGFPALSLDDKDRLYVIWELFESLRGRPRGLGFTHSSDGGETFASASVMPGTADPRLGFNGSQQGLLMRELAVNQTGAIAVVNNTFRTKRAVSCSFAGGLHRWCTQLVAKEKRALVTEPDSAGPMKHALRMHNLPTALTPSGIREQPPLVYKTAEEEDHECANPKRCALLRPDAGMRLCLDSGNEAHRHLFAASEGR